MRADRGMLILAPRPGKACVVVITDDAGSRIGELAMSAMVGENKKEISWPVEAVREAIRKTEMTDNLGSRW